MGEDDVNLISVLCKLLFHINLDVRRGLFIRKPRPAPCKAIIFVHAVRPANGDASLLAEAIDFAILCKKDVRVRLLIPNRSAAVFLCLIARNMEIPMSAKLRTRSFLKSFLCAVICSMVMIMKNS